MTSESIKATACRALGPAIHDRAAKLGLYRECLLLAQVAESAVKGKSSKTEVQNSWRKQRGASGVMLEVVVASCIDRISYARMCLCKQRCKLVPAASEKYPWNVINPGENQTRYTRKRHENESNASMGDTGKGNRDFVPISNWGFGNIDPEMHVLKKQTFDRQYFKGPHWRNKVKPKNIEELSFEESAVMYGRGVPKIPKTPKKHF